MSTDKIISAASLAFIENSLQRIVNNISDVSGQVESVGRELVSTHVHLQELILDFKTFVEEDLKAKNLQLAETRMVKVRQELEQQFGHYGEVRRRATGILQAVDVSIVRQETIRNTTEELMLSTPRYWLAPALIALSSWLSDNKQLAEKALSEAMRRNDEKTSLFFSLVCRRGGRYNASREWLDRYFGQQQPLSLSREVVVTIDAYANGVFGADNRGQCARRIEEWIVELSQRVGFIEEQHNQWVKALLSKGKFQDYKTYTYLSQYSPTWPKLVDCLNGAHLHDTILQYFTGVFTGEIVPLSNVAVAVDDLLDNLVTNFDDEELPLRKTEKLLALIVDCDGDRTMAQQRLDSEQKALEAKVDFTQLLTNFAMYPETSHASKATQRLATGLSREWIISAHNDITAKNRSSVPLDIEISIDQWKGITRDGSNELEMVTSLEANILARKNLAVSAIKIGVIHWAALSASALFLLIGIANFN